MIDDGPLMPERPGRRPPNFKKCLAHTYGKLSVLRISEHKASNGRTLWYCRCQCGNYCEVRSDRLESGRTTSCPECARAERIKRLAAYSKQKAQAKKKPGQKKGASHGERTE